VPGYAPRLTFHAAAAGIARWRAAHPEDCQPDSATDAIVDRLVTGHRSARDIYSSLGAAARAAV
jgi:hypothetical protein